MSVRRDRLTGPRIAWAGAFSPARALAVPPTRRSFPKRFLMTAAPRHTGTLPGFCDPPPPRPGHPPCMHSRPSHTQLPEAPPRSNVPGHGQLASVCQASRHPFPCVLPEEHLLPMSSPLERSSLHRPAHPPAIPDTQAHRSSLLSPGSRRGGPAPWASTAAAGPPTSQLLSPLPLPGLHLLATGQPPGTISASSAQLLPGGTRPGLRLHQQPVLRAGPDPSFEGPRSPPACLTFPLGPRVHLLPGSPRPPRCLPPPRTSLGNLGGAHLVLVPCTWQATSQSHLYNISGSASCVSPWLRTLGRDTCHGPFHSLHSIQNDCCTCKSGHLTPFSKPPCVCTDPACPRPRGPVPLGHLFQAFAPPAALSLSTWLCSAPFTLCAPRPGESPPRLPAFLLCGLAVPQAVPRASGVPYLQSA